MTDLPKLFLEAIKSGKIYVISIGLSAGVALFCPWEVLKDKTKTEFWLAMIFLFCCTFLACSLIEVVWLITKNQYSAGAKDRRMKVKLSRLHPIEKAVLLTFIKHRERFVMIPILEMEPDIYRHLSHLYTHGLIENYSEEYGSYRAAGPVGYKCQISDRLWDMFADMNDKEIQRLLS